MKVVSQDAPTDEAKAKGKREESGDWDEVRKRIADFFSSTSIHGMGRIYGVGHWWRKVMWCCFSMTMSTWALYQIVSVAVDYGKYPKKITRSVEKDTPTVFPAVTVCNLSPMPSVDALKEHPTWGVFIQVETSFNNSNECDKGVLTKSKLVTNSTGKPLPQEESEEEDLVTQELKILQSEVFLRGLLRKPEKQRNGTGRKGHAEGKRWLASEWEKLTSRNNGESNIKAGESTMARRRNTEGTAKRRDPLVDISEKIQIVMELLATSHLRSLDDKDGRNIILDRLDKIIRKSQKGLRGNFVRWSNNTMRDGNSTSRNVTNSTEIERTRERFRNLLDEYSSLKHAGGSSRRSGITSLAKSSLSKEDQSSAFLLSVPQDLNHTSRSMRSSVSEGECGVGYMPCGDGTCYREHKHCNNWLDCANRGDEKNCSCDADFYMCFGKDKVCIHQALLCDGFGDCLFEDDEMECEVCREGAWRCSNGRCIRAYSRCDGSEDCPDGEDEVWCGGAAPSCGGGDFQCASSGRCLPAVHRCDGREQCDDGSDEADCTECAEGLFQCGDDTCLPLHLVCDDEEHCVDGADEADCWSWSSECPDNLHYSCSSAFWSDYCLHPRFVCDGVNDCWGWEEQGCYECSESASSCGDGTCLQKSQWCDGQDDCADGRDETNCTAGCQGIGYHCEGGGRCIGLSLVCDGRTQCEDESDEADCDEGCSSEEFQCNNGLCISKSFTCDAVEDCIAGEDESGCESCAPRRFHCEEDNICIQEHYVCDEVLHCSNGSDESNCARACPHGYFTCNSGLCIHGTFRCDGVSYCRYNEDELKCDVCAGDAFLCPEGRCLPAYMRCDGEPECDGGEDERECSGCRRGVLCEVEMMLTCLPEKNICDGRIDCASGVDEMMCSQYLVVCPSGYFQCNDSRCIRERYKCDGLNDCLLGEDEEDCDACVDEGQLCEKERRCVSGPVPCFDEELCPSPFQPNCTSQTVAMDAHCQPGYLWCEGGGCVNYRFLCDGRLHCPDGEDEVNCDNIRDLPLANEVHWIRIMCSQYYADLVSLQGMTLTEPPSHLSSFTCEDNYNEIVTWSVICQLGVFCDN
ncbi:low-density lipoprotein receptor-related protein 1-like [Penaeus monodon]|uniref:low-density lipoprotein receptor-related protein 1-like n=1 Tax=Penaeus monodon TaxID=6687 RepID=UPI0018A707A4|nr:low-density lipoprotein receptor-related protein 1-like [Penaeus monodon]